MPTGLTAAIVDRDNSYTFEKFATRCARHMGALYHMRDDSLDAPIRMQKEDLYHQKNARLADETLQSFLKLEHQQQLELFLEHKQTLKSRSVDITEAKKASLVHILAMREKVVAWQPPTTEHEGLKKFMLSQLDETIRFDGLRSEDDVRVETSFEFWREERIVELKRSVAYHTEEADKAEKRVRENNAWISAFEESLK